MKATVESTTLHKVTSTLLPVATGTSRTCGGGCGGGAVEVRVISRVQKRRTATKLTAIDTALSLSYDRFRNIRKRVGGFAARRQV